MKTLEEEINRLKETIEADEVSLSAVDDSFHHEKSQHEAREFLKTELARDKSKLKALQSIVED